MKLSLFCYYFYCRYVTTPVITLSILLSWFFLCLVVRGSVLWRIPSPCFDGILTWRGSVSLFYIWIYGYVYRGSVLQRISSPCFDGVLIWRGSVSLLYIQIYGCIYRGSVLQRISSPCFDGVLAQQFCVNCSECRLLDSCFVVMKCGSGLVYCKIYLCIFCGIIRYVCGQTFSPLSGDFKIVGTILLCLKVIGL